MLRRAGALLATTARKNHGIFGISRALSQGRRFSNPTETAMFLAAMKRSGLLDGPFADENRAADALVTLNEAGLLESPEAIENLKLVFDEDVISACVAQQHQNLNLPLKLNQ